MISETDPTTGVRNRTRRAILDAAIQLLGENPAASLSDIAQAAEVGRTTLHRYFPSRTDLLNALSIDTLEQIEAATVRARLEEGTAAEALERLCVEYFDLGDLLSVMFNTPELTSCEGWEDETNSDRRLLDLIERGHADGSIDPQMSPQWVVMELLWSTLYAGWDYIRKGTGTKHEARQMVLLTISRAVTPPA